jgi:hypothetical protein
MKAVVISQTKCTRDILKDCTKNEGKCWTEFYKYEKRRRGNKENIPAIEDVNGRLVTDPTEINNNHTENIFGSIVDTCVLSHCIATVAIPTELSRLPERTELSKVD